ncbi:MAG: hypothetical protein AAB495_04275 [Patescibacteria group bacterium]
MDILVCIPADKEDHVRAYKLNPASGFDIGYWKLRRLPRFAKPGDRIWFSIYGTVIASARIRDRNDSFDFGVESEMGENQSPAVSFYIKSVTGHHFDAPREIPLAFRGFRYVRMPKGSLVRSTEKLEPIPAKLVAKIHPRKR